jgi:hypothetical protein
MNKNKVREVLRQLHEQQLHANLGGIVGGEENEQYAKDDLKLYDDCLVWFDKHVMSKKGIK